LSILTDDCVYSKNIPFLIYLKTLRKVVLSLLKSFQYTTYIDYRSLLSLEIIIEDTFAFGLFGSTYTTGPAVKDIDSPL